LRVDVVKTEALKRFANGWKNVKIFKAFYLAKFSRTNN